MSQDGMHQLMRIGHGFDVHRFSEESAEGGSIRLCGVDIPHPKILLAHSDGDVALHAICDALLGAIAAGDIGQHFPDDDDSYEDADSRHLLRQVYAMVIDAGYVLGNLDVTIIAQKPKLAQFITGMREAIADDLSASKSSINVKATTTEGLGPVGREEGIAVHAVVILYRSA